jgi:nitrate/nitrite transport system ATP-binding protein
MTNGPGAVLAEIVENPLPKSRARNDFHKHPLYYALRNHIIDFLVERSKTFVAQTPGFDPRHVPVIRPGAVEPVVVAANGDTLSTSLPGSTRQSIANA